MNWDALGAIAELIGGIGVIATLGYLAIQIRHSNRQENLRAVKETVQEFVNFYANLTATRSDAELLSKGLADFDSLDNADKAVFHGKMQLLSSGYYQVLALKQTGALTDTDLFAKSEELFLSMIKTPGGKAWWRTYRHLPPVEWRDYVEAKIDELGDQLTPANESQIWLSLK